MVQSTRGLHHFHKRKRVYELGEPYPHPNKLKRFIDKIIYPVSIFGPIMTIPQITQIFVNKDASGVSALSWSAYLITAVFWLLYGIIHKEKPIILMNVLWIILEALVVVGAVIY